MKSVVGGVESVGMGFESGIVDSAAGSEGAVESSGGKDSVEVPVVPLSPEEVELVSGSVGGGDATSAVGVVEAALEVKMWAFFTAKAVQLKFMSVGAGLLRSIVNPFTLFLVTIYCTFAAKMASSLPEFSIEIVVFTMGCSKYSLSKATSTDLSPDFTTANPAVSWLKYGRPKNMASFMKLIASFTEAMWSTVSPCAVI